MALLTVLFQPLGLGEGGCGLLAVHRVQQVHLFLFFEERQLIGRVEGNFLLVHHVQQFGDEFGETDVTLNLSAADTSFFTNYIGHFQLPDELSGS